MRCGWRGPNSPEDFPSLGWGVLEWLAAYLPSPSDASKPFVCTDQQALRILEWFRIDPIAERFVHRRAIHEDAKGSGKSPMAGGLMLAELGAAKAGDSAGVIFDGWDAAGEPVGRPWGTKGSPGALIQIASVSEDQSQNTYGALFELLTANDHKAAKTLGIDDGRTRLYLKGRPGQLEPVTASFGSREGQRLTAAVLDETHLWNERNGGVKLARTLRRNAAKMNGRTYETTNAPVLGEKSVAESSGNDALAGKAGIYYCAPRPKETPQPDWSDERLLAALEATYAGAYWVDRPRLVREMRDMPWTDVLRFFYNIRTTGQGTAVDPLVWKALRSKTMTGLPEAGTRIGAGFDGSVSRDGTVLRGRTADGYGFLIGKWVRPAAGSPEMLAYAARNPGKPWEVPRDLVNEAVERMFERYDVGLMICDPAFWRSEIDGWAKAHGEKVVIALDTNQPSRMAPAVDRWLTGIRTGFLTHDGDEFTTANVVAAHLKTFRAGDGENDGRTLYTLIKGEDGGRIDAAIADVLATEAAATMPEKKRYRKSAFSDPDYVPFRL